MTLPIIVILALVFGNAGNDNPGGGPSSTQPTALPALTPSAPPSNAAAVAPCTKVLEVLPERLGDLLPRAVHPKPDSVFVVAWGDPPVVLRCGMPRPDRLKPASSDQIFSANGAGGVYWLPVRGKDSTVWTAIDRAVYIELTVPNSYSQPPLAPLGAAIAKALPRVCRVPAGAGQSQPPAARLCTRRK